jgi:dihydroorotate dehydrogenase
MSWWYRSVVRPLLFTREPERVHSATLSLCETTGSIGWMRRAARAMYEYRDARLEQTIAGIHFANPLGLAAGFDKNGHAVELVGEFGFGHVEIGSVSAYPSNGNPRPRLFRIPADEAIVVNYGVPNEGADAVSTRLARKSCAVPLGINLVKTNDSARPASDEEVFNDYASAFAVLAPHADYINLNMSCPNSANDQNFFDDLPKIHLLLERLAALSPQVPVFLKLKPTTDPAVVSTIVAIADGFPFVTGFGINLPSGKPAALRLTTPSAELATMPGAVSGRPVEQLINANLRLLYEAIGRKSRYTLMAAGGVYSAADAYRKIRLGASLVQLYTAMVYHGPGVVRNILRGLVTLLERDGFGHINEAVGVDVEAAHLAPR